MRWLASLVAVVAASAAIAGTAVGADRLERHVVKGQGLSLAVPASWIAVDSRVPAHVVERLSRENPRLAQFMQGLAQPNSPMKFIALDPVVRNGFATNVNVVVAPVPAGVTFSDYRRGLVAELRTLVGTGRIAQSVVTIAGVRGLRVRYSFQLRLGRTFTVRTLQYAFLRQGRSIVVTYTTLPSSAARYEATFQRSAASIRFSR
jgi:hypothetical protein